MVLGWVVGLLLTTRHYWGGGGAKRQVVQSAWTVCNIHCVCVCACVGDGIQPNSLRHTTPSQPIHVRQLATGLREG